MKAYKIITVTVYLSNRKKNRLTFSFNALKKLLI